ncbi:MAG: TIGR00303 family protein [Synechococcales bacterium]|nr:TIGR00303 family protein [Synechococcales bacterium]
MIRCYTQCDRAEAWLTRYRGQKPTFACVLGFTDTALIPGISAAGATPESRQFTALADAEYLYQGGRSQPTYPLPPLTAGVSPTVITRSLLQACHITPHLFTTGLPSPLSIPAIDLTRSGWETAAPKITDRPQNVPISGARCVTTGQAMDLARVRHLFQAGLQWGERLGNSTEQSYLILAECVVGGTTTALAVLLGLGIAAIGKVNSSHAQCNHQQKLDLVQQGLNLAQIDRTHPEFPLQLIAAVGDPMQPVVAGMAIAASRTCGVLLAGGTQMLAVYALAHALQKRLQLDWQVEQILIGTTRWVAEDPTADTVGLATLIEGAPLIATQLNFSQSSLEVLQMYEKGFVKEGVGAGASAIAATLYQQWDNQQCVRAIETQINKLRD